MGGGGGVTLLKAITSDADGCSCWMGVVVVASDLGGRGQLAQIFGKRHSWLRYVLVTEADFTG